MTLNDICESNPSFILDQANPTGGTYYINDIPMSLFDTDSLPTGDYIIRYDYSDPVTSCNNTVEGIISLLPSPTASFVLGPQPTDLDNPNIRFFNTSEDFTNLIWNIGNNQTIEDETDFIYTYTDTGTYIAQLIIINEYNCSDTISKKLIINPVYSIFIPTSFTPNDDNMNEVFEPIINAAQSYIMKIYDRWGGIIYQGENQGWDGKNAPSGQYFYSIEIIDYKNTSYSISLFGNKNSNEAVGVQFDKFRYDSLISSERKYFLEINSIRNFISVWKKKVVRKLNSKNIANLKFGYELYIDTIFIENNNLNFSLESIKAEYTNDGFSNYSYVPFYNTYSGTYDRKVNPNFGGYSHDINLFMKFNLDGKLIWSSISKMNNFNTFSNKAYNLSLIHISEPTRPY